MSLFKRNLLRLMDLTGFELNQLIALSSDMKAKKDSGKEEQYLQGKKIVLLFEQESTRTRCAFEVAAFDQGANVTFLESKYSHIGHKESIKDTGRFLGRLYDGIQYRGESQNIVETLAKYAGVPVWNGLTSTFHPTQLLADMMTMREKLPDRPFNQMKLAYVGDARNNISNTLLEASALTGLDLRLVAPRIYWPDQNLVMACRILAQQNGGNITITEDIVIGVKNVDFIYTDVWVSMADDQDRWEERIMILKPYQVNMEMLSKTDNVHIKFLHCLPSFHDSNTVIGNKISEKYSLSKGIEVTNEVFESSYSIVFDQAENRLHTIKSLIVTTMIEMTGLY